MHSIREERAGRFMQMQMQCKFDSMGREAPLAETGLVGERGSNLSPAAQQEEKERSSAVVLLAEVGIRVPLDDRGKLTSSE